MTNQELERKLAKALEHTAPDDLEGVLSRCETRKGTVIDMTSKRKRPVVRNLIAACLALVLVGGGGLFYQQSYAVASVVSLDVNPSIELTVNQKESVLRCTALNAEGTEVLADMAGGKDLEGIKLDVAVNAVVGSLVRYGYLDSISSAILISVEDKNQDRAAKLREELTGTVDAVLQHQASQAAVLSQTVPQSAQLDKQAKQSNISTGKAYLVQQVMERNGIEKQNELSALSVEELKDLLETGENRLPIGREQAVFYAEEYAGILTVEGVTTDVDAELDDRTPHYEVELRHPTLGEFEYRVDAYTGAVLSGQKDIFDAASGYLTKEQALQKAKEHMVKTNPELEGKELTAAYARLEEDDAVQQYKVEFYCGGYEFDYELDAKTGQVLEWDREKDKLGVIGGTTGYVPIVTQPKENQSDRNTTDVGEDKAKAAALAHAGRTESEVTALRVKRDWDDGRLEYEVDFKANGLEYEYTIDGTTAAVLEHELDRDD